MDEQKVCTPWHRNPIWVGLIGLALMVVGTKLSSWVPPLTPRQAEQAERLVELRGKAPAELGERLDEYARNVGPQPPYRLPGRLLLGAGVLLFVLAGVLMFRRPAAPEGQQASEGPADEVAVRPGEGPAAPEGP